MYYMYYILGSTTMAPPAYLAPWARVQIPLKVRYHAVTIVLGAPLAVSAVAVEQRDSARIASSW